MEENIIKNTTENKSSDGSKNIAGAIVIAGLLIAGAVLLKGNTSSSGVQNTGSTTSKVATDLRPVSADEHILGDPNAKIIIVEYSDTECPFCKSFHNTLHGVISKNKDVAWVYRHYPIASLHPKAFHEAEATECALEQGGNSTFWKYLDEIYTRTQSNNKLDVAELPKIAKDIGLDVPLFNTCLASGKFLEKIQADMKEPGNVGTPYSVVLTKEDISTKTRGELAASLNQPGAPEAISFSSTKKNALTMNGALPVQMVEEIIRILLK